MDEFDDIGPCVIMARLETKLIVNFLEKLKF